MDDTAWVVTIFVVLATFGWLFLIFGGGIHRGPK